MAEPGARIRIVTCDDHPIFRDGLRRLLEAEPGFAVVGEAADGEAALRLAADLRPDIMLLDVSMPRVTGLAVMQTLGAVAPTTRAILLTASIDNADVVNALQLGARGIVLKETATDLLFKCIRCVMDGQYWVGREGVANLVHTLKALMSETENHARNTYRLTKREFEVVGAIVESLSNREIAKRFTISEDTVKHHLTNIFDKLGVSTRLELALFAVQHKLVDTL